MNKHEIVQLIDRHTVAEGVTNTPLEGLQLCRMSYPMRRILGVYDPSLCVIVQGSKRAYLSGKTYIYDENQYLCCTRPLPVEAEVVEAAPEKPLLGLLLSLETRIMVETVLEMAAMDSSYYEIVRTGSSNLTFLAARHLFPFFSPLSGLKHLLQRINSL